MIESALFYRFFRIDLLYLFFNRENEQVTPSLFLVCNDGIKKLINGFPNIVAISKESHFYVLLKFSFCTANDVKVMPTQTLGSFYSLIWWQLYWRATECPFVQFSILIYGREQNF